MIKDGKLKSAAPLDKGSRIITHNNGVIKDGPLLRPKRLLTDTSFVAKDIQEAVEIAKANPIFTDIPTKMEVHLLKAVGG